LKENIKIIRYK